MEEIKHAPVHERHQELEHRSAYRSKRKGEHGRVLHLALQDAVLLVLRHLIEPRVLAHLSFEKIAPLCFLGESARTHRYSAAKALQKAQSRWDAVRYRGRSVSDLLS